MEKINFIKSTPAQAQREIARWYHISLATFMVLTLIVVSVQLIQIIQLYENKREYYHVQQSMQRYHKTAATYKDLQEKEQQLLTHLEVIKNKGTKNKSHPLFILDAIVKKFPLLIIQGCTTSKTQVQLRVTCSTYSLLQQLLATLREYTLFSTASVTELQCQEQVLHATITGNLKKL